MIDWSTVLICLIGSGGISTILFKLFDLISKRKHKKDDLQESRDALLVLLAWDALIRIMRECIASGCMSISKRQFCDKIYKAYKNLGGNDVVDTLWAQCHELPME